MSIKTSITVGLLLMLALLVGCASYAFYTVQCLERSAHTILQDNFYSVQLGQAMLQDLDPTGPTSQEPTRLGQFGAQLAKEAGNVSMLQELSQDETVSKYASNLVYLTRSKDAKRIESRIIYSILRKKPKRADHYWFLNISLLNEPFGMRYTLETLVPDVAYKINFQLGFRIQPRINLLFRRVLEDMGKQGEIDITSRYATLQKRRLPGDFRFVVLDKVLSFDNQLSFKESFILKSYFFINKLAITDQQAFGLDTSDVTVENVPLTIQPYRQLDLQRMAVGSQSDPVPAATIEAEHLAQKV